jgi:transposase
MRKNDARLLSPIAQEELRRRTVDAVLNGMPQTEASVVFGVSRSSVAKWMSIHRKGGEKALDIKKRGRRRGISLKPLQVAQIVRTITDHCPDQVKLPWALWTCEAVGQYIQDHFDIILSRWTIARYLKQWGFTPQKPMRRAFEQNPEAVQRWLEVEYPAIHRQAKLEKADIHWGDESGFRSDHQTGTTWSPKGKTPVVSISGKRFSLNMISTVSNRGLLRFKVFKGRFNVDVFISFLRRLIKTTNRKVFLIVDNLSVHKAKKVKDWIKDKEEQLRIFYLPPYSPEMNPDEYLNNDVKSNAVGRRRAKDVEELGKNLRAYLRSTQRQPDIVKRFFQAKSVKYAAV